MPNCELCGEPMPSGEEMFKYHGYSGPCPKPPLPTALPGDEQGRETPPPLWRHAVNECDEAHKALDAAGAPKTTRVRRVRGPDGDQDITIGLAERVRALARSLPAPSTVTVSREDIEKILDVKNQWEMELIGVCGALGVYPPAGYEGVAELTARRLAGLEPEGKDG